MRKHLRAKIERLGFETIDRLNALKLTAGETVEFLDILKDSFTEVVSEVKAEGKLLQPVASLSARKPYNNRPGYVSSRVADVGGHIVIYDREKGGAPFANKEAARWVVMHEPSGRYMSASNLTDAREIQRTAAATTVAGLRTTLTRGGK